MKIAVYTIAKNEERFSARWAETCRDADYRIVLDTGSADQTVSALRKCGVTVLQSTVLPWRFDTARNLALDAIPADAEVCISLDMDELLSPGWRAAIEREWKPGATRLRYPDIRAWSRDGTPERVIQGFKIHSRTGYRWQYAIHEILIALSPEHEIRTSGLEIHHRPDPAKDRGLYDSLLEKCVEAEPDEPHYRYYGALRLVSNRRFEEAISALAAFLELPIAGLEPQRSNAFRLSAWCRKQLGHDGALVFRDLLAAAIEVPGQRESWAGLAAYSGERGRWAQAFAFTGLALRCKDPRFSMFLDPPLWNGKLEQMAASSAQALVGRRGVEPGLLEMGRLERQNSDAPFSPETRACFHHVLQRPHDAERWALLALRCAKEAEWPLTLAAASEALEKSPERSEDPPELPQHLFDLARQRMSLEAGNRL